MKVKPPNYKITHHNFNGVLSRMMENTITVRRVYHEGDRGGGDRFPTMLRYKFGVQTYILYD